MPPRAVANHANLTPDTVAQSMVFGVAERGGLMKPSKTIELMAMAYFALNLQTDGAWRPGRIRDYIPLYDFEVDVGCDPVAEKFSVEICAVPDPSIHQG
jgi:hypothetical protein